MFLNAIVISRKSKKNARCRGATIVKREIPTQMSVDLLHPPDRPENVKRATLLVE
jgi:hypothetical protein